jgi:hypothetical protein
MRGALGEASELASRWLSGAAVALAALLSIILGAFVDPIIGAIALVLTLVALVIAFTYALRVKALFEGPYEVLDNDISWELSGDKGEIATIRNHRHVRFNYRCAVIVERINGMPVGTIETLAPEYGAVIKRAKRRDEEYAIVELPADKQRNEEGHLTYELTLKEGFPTPEECWIGHATAERTKKANLDVTFPVNHRPIGLTLWRESSKKTEEVKEIQGWEEGMRCASWTEGGRVHFRLRERPKRTETYRLEWIWEN